MTSAESGEDEDEDDDLNNHRYLKIRFDPSIALCDGMFKSCSIFVTQIRDPRDVYCRALILDQFIPQLSTLHVHAH